MLCAQIVKEGAMFPGGHQLKQRCPAAAMPGSIYCPVHAREKQMWGPSTRPLSASDLDRDVLPWSDADHLIFRAHPAARKTRW